MTRFIGMSEDRVLQKLRGVRGVTVASDSEDQRQQLDAEIAWVGCD
jgi:hypothetical protein